MAFASATRHVVRGVLFDALVAALLMAAAVLYWDAGAPLAREQSSAPHYVLFADALLNGHLWVDPVRAARLVDVTPLGGRYYVAFPPLAAILMLPIVAVAGPRFNDALFTLVLGASNVGLTYLLARRLSRPGFAGPGLKLGRAEAIGVALVLGAGTMHFYASLMGRVWFTAHVVAVTFLLLYLLECAGRGRPVVAGLALAAAFLARPPAALAAVFWLILAVRWNPPVGQLFGHVLKLAAPMAFAMALMLGANWARFGAPFNFGYLSMRVSPRLAPDLQRYGQFNLYFVRRNVEALMVTPPAIDFPKLVGWMRSLDGPAGLLRDLGTPARQRRNPFPVQFDPWGTGIWAVSPVLLFALRPPLHGQRALALAAWLSVLAVALPNLLYYNTGWYQFGYRFSLDFTPFLLVLLAIGVQRPLHPAWCGAFWLLLGVSVLSNALGARWFLRLPPY
ncbi:MAG: hypothetical protein HY332_21920 [Chloroflexi bacterium]|nr:hypothetical protein [Chloroflexota bacterium]